MGVMVLVLDLVQKARVRQRGGVVEDSLLAARRNGDLRPSAELIGRG